MTPALPEAAYAARIASLLDRLGIPADYAAVRGMTLQPEASEMVPARILADGRELRLTPATASAWRDMVAAAAAEGVTLLLISGFRSVDHQAGILERKRASGQSMEEILRVNAAPGYSEHHTGRAVDIGTPGSQPLEETFENTAAFQWLEREAGRFGFRMSYPRHHPSGIIYEPWHWLHQD